MHYPLENYLKPHDIKQVSAQLFEHPQANIRIR
jgi:hypothetical protein